MGQTLTNCNAVAGDIDTLLTQQPGEEDHPPNRNGILGGNFQCYGEIQDFDIDNQFPIESQPGINAFEHILLLHTKRCIQKYRSTRSLASQIPRSSSSIKYKKRKLPKSDVEGIILVPQQISVRRRRETHNKGDQLCSDLYRLFLSPNMFRQRVIMDPITWESNDEALQYLRRIISQDVFGPVPRQSSSRSPNAVIDPLLRQSSERSSMSSKSSSSFSVLSSSNRPSLKDIMFHGFGSYCIRRVSDSDINIPSSCAYIADVSSLYNFEVREDLKRYGAIGYFNPNKDCIGIYVSYLGTYFTVNDEPVYWDHAKFVFASSVFTFVELVLHMGKIHLMEMNALVTCAREHLSGNHCLYALLAPFLHGIIGCNEHFISRLVEENGLLDRVFGFEHHELLRLLSACIENYEYRTIYEHVIGTNMTRDMDPEKFNLASGCQLFDRVRVFVKGYCDIYYHNSFDAIKLDDEAFSFYLALARTLNLRVRGVNYKYFISVLASLILSGSCLDDLFGNTLNVVKYADLCGGVIYDGYPKMNSRQNYIQLNCYKIVCGLRQVKLLNDFEHVLLDDEHIDKTRSVFKKFQDDLRLFAGRFEADGEKVLDQSFDPRRLQCSAH